MYCYVLIYRVPLLTHSTTSCQIGQGIKPGRTVTERRNASHKVRKRIEEGTKTTTAAAAATEAPAPTATIRRLQGDTLRISEEQTSIM